MRCDWPDLKRCCCCIPLRRGLLAWGYLKVGLIMLIWIPMGTVLYFTLAFGGYIDINMILTVLLLLVDFGFNISFLIAAHTKNFKLFKVYYYYILVFTVVITIFILVMMGISISMIIKHGLQHNLPEQLAIGLSLTFLNIVLQVYIMILVKSEIRKLENNSQFEFINNEAQSQVKSNLQMDHIDVPEKNIFPEKGIIL